METPKSTTEVNEMAWALANGMRHVQELERRAETIVGQVDRTRDKVQKLLVSVVSAANDQNIDPAALQGIEDLAADLNVHIDEDSNLAYDAGQLRTLVGPDKEN